MRAIVIRRLFIAGLFGASTLAWISYRGFWPVLILFIVIQVVNLISERFEHGSRAWYGWSSIVLAGGALLFLGAPVAVWLKWGWVQGVIYGLVTIWGLTRFLVDEWRDVKARILNSPGG